MINYAQKYKKDGVRPRSTIATEQANKTRLEFKYDYQGRRTGKKVYAWVSGAWNLTNTEKYAYDSWNELAVYDVNDALQKSYLWGIDMSGSLQGSGGVGGLLAENSNSASYYPVYDGNGKIHAYTDASGSIVAEYEYAPFGQTTSKSGTRADDFAFRFSTKQLDKDLNVYFYNNGRGYNPDTGRWISRDPIEEKDSPNLYGFVKNNPVSSFDVLGMWGSDVHRDMTAAWAVSINYPSVAANAIGGADNAVDYGPTSPLPPSLPYIGGDQSYHFNRPWNDAVDSRIKHSADLLKIAQNHCSDNSSFASVVDKPEIAVVALGMSLHPLQDYYAHGDFGRYTKGDILSPHNIGSPQYLFGLSLPVNYPDDPTLDSYGPDGRPAGVYGKQFVVQYTWVTGEYARFKSGSLRITKTKSVTINELKGFQQYLKTQKKCCKCLDYFGILQ